MIYKRKLLNNLIVLIGFDVINIYMALYAKEKLGQLSAPDFLICLKSNQSQNIFF